LFRHKIIRLLKSKDLLSDERVELLDSFRHSGFSVDASVTVWPQDTEGLERLSRYLLRCPLSLSRIHWTPGAKTLFYEAKGSHDDPLASHQKGETLDVFEFLARVLTQIPKPRQHGVHYMGAYSSRARAYRKRKNLPLQSLTSQQDQKAKPEPKLSPKKRAALRKRWAQLIKRVHQTDPLRCDCGGTLGSSRRKKTRPAPATQALATDFRPRHLSEHPRHENGRIVSSHPSSPGRRHSSTALPYLLELCYGY